jgi:hypothetical protein
MSAVRGLFLDTYTGCNQNTRIYLPVSTEWKNMSFLKKVGISGMTV